MSLLMAGFKGLFVGVVVFFIPAVTARFLDQGKQDSISDFYTGAAMSVLGRGVMVIRSNGGQLLKKSKFNTRDGGEEVRLGGETKQWRNPGGMMLTLQGKPFGLVHEDRDVMFDIRTAHIAELYNEYKESGEWKIDGYRKAYANVKKGINLVNVRAILPAVQSSASPGLADRIDSFVEKMESMFDSSNVFEYLPWVVAVGAGFGLVWLLAKLGTTGGGGGVGIPL